MDKQHHGCDLIGFALIVFGIVLGIEIYAIPKHQIDANTIILSLVVSLIFFIAGLFLVLKKN